MNLTELVGKLDYSNLQLFPCGFLSITATTRSSTARKILQDYGFSYNDYSKKWEYVVHVPHSFLKIPQHNQSLNLKALYANEIIKTFEVMPEFEKVEFGIWSKED